MNDKNQVFQDENDQRQRMDWEDQQQENDLARAKDELDDFFIKCEAGMVTSLDVEEAKENLKLFGVNLT